MSGPYRLRLLHLFVTRRSAGAFILSRHGRLADFVGFSTDDVAGALARFRNGSGYRYFWYAYARSPAEAASLAGYWYHRYRPTDNVVPPEGIDHSSWRCSIAGCSACALTLAGR